MLGSTLKRGCLPAAGALAALAVTLTACAGGQADKADPVGSTTATLNGYWMSTGTPALVGVYFRYGTTTAYEGRIAAPQQDGNCIVGFDPGGSLCVAPGPANTVHKYSAPVDRLTPNTTYHFVLCANDDAPRREFCGSDKTFKTSP